MYFNANSDICGRELEVLSLDSRADAGADQQAYAKACEQAFAAVGSMSAFDSGGAGTAEDCGLPDIRTTSVTLERGGCSTCFGAQSNDPAYFENAVPTTSRSTTRRPARRAPSSTSTPAPRRPAPRARSGR